MAAVRLGGVFLGVALAGCRLFLPRPEMTERVILDACSGATWRNHVKVVRDPLGRRAEVMRGEQVSPAERKMTFLQDNGFLRVPETRGEELILRIFVRGGGRLRVALATADRIKSYYREIAETDVWLDVVLPLDELRERFPVGTPIRDITIWLQAADSDAQRAATADLYLDRILLRQPASGGGR